MEKEEYNDQVEGRNAVLELLESGRDINKILVSCHFNNNSNLVFWLFISSDLKTEVLWWFAVLDIIN